MATSKTQFGFEKNTFKLEELSNKCCGKYPAIVTVGSPDYECLFSEDISPGTELLICKPRCVEYCRIKILPYADLKRVSYTKGSQHISERDKYNGREFLIPLEYPGKLQVVTDSERKNRLTSVSQVLNDLPTYIQFCQNLHCDSPIDGKKQFIDADTTLEVKGVKFDPNKGRNHLICKTNNNEAIYLPEDCLINGKALFSLSSLAKSSKTLPQKVLFELVEPNDVILHDDDDASELLLLMGGHISVLSVTSRNVYVAWIKKADGQASRKLAVLPEQVWHTVVVSLCEFIDNVERRKHIRETYGDYFETEFIRSSLYKMSPMQDHIVYISEPRVQNIDNYEEPIPLVRPRTVTEYMNYSLPAQTDGQPEGEDGSYIELQQWTSPFNQSGHRHGKKLQNNVQPIIAAPSYQMTKPIPEKDELILLPKHVNINKESKIKVLKKLGMGFEKVHKQLVKHFEEKTYLTSENTYSRKLRVTHEQFSLPTQNDDQPGGRDPSYVELQPWTSQFNQSGHRQGKKLQNNVQPMTAAPSYSMSTIVSDTLQRLPDMDKISKPDQTNEDFYSYSTDEVVECFKLCGLDTMAKHCHENVLDGEFFQNLSVHDIEECFDLKNYELFKVQQIIELGWRPKLSK